MNQDQQISMSSLRLIAIALIAGQLMFAGVVAFLLYGMEQDGGFGADGLEILSTVAAGFAVLIVPVAFVLRGARLARLAEVDADRRLPGYAGAVIMFLALLEGASLFNIVAWLVTGQLVPSLPVVVVLVAIALAAFPSRTQLENIGR